MTITDDHHARQETGALIDHIVRRYHAPHRAELVRLLRQAELVSKTHSGDPSFPRGLIRALLELKAEMESHMAKEEQALFPAMRSGGMTGIGRPIQGMRTEHQDHDESIALIRHLTNDLTPPCQACGSWRQLYDGLHRFFLEIHRHRTLEHDVLFARFEEQ